MLVSLLLQTDFVVFWRGVVAVVLPAQIRDQLLQTLILVDPGNRLLDEGHDSAERPEDKPVRTAGGAAVPLCSHCGVIT